jgi:enamine deaminase RidA (YjgF/YER057c/UK114 family)
LKEVLVSHVEQRLEELGLVLPDEVQLPPGVDIPFRWVRSSGNRVFISGHGALAPDGSPAGPFGKVPSEVSVEEAQESARLATLAILASLRRSIGDLDRVTCWLVANGFINADGGYPQTTLVMNAFSHLIPTCMGPTPVRTRARRSELPRSR